MTTFARSAQPCLVIEAQLCSDLSLSDPPAQDLYGVFFFSCINLCVCDKTCFIMLFALLMQKGLQVC